MQTKTASYCAVVLLTCWFLAGDRRAAAQPQADVHAGAKQAFAERIARYTTLRARFEEPLPAFVTRRDSWSLFLMRRYLASAIRTARARAGIGDVFTAEVSDLFAASSLVLSTRSTSRDSSMRISRRMTSWWI